MLWQNMTRGVRLLTTAKQEPNRIAPRYCFRAKCRVQNATTGKVVGEFTCYDKSPDVGRDVFIACRLFAEGKELEFVNFGLECTEVELVLFETCPIECERKVLFTEFP